MAKYIKLPSIPKKYIKDGLMLVYDQEFATTDIIKNQIMYALPTDNNRNIQSVYMKIKDFK